jgi:hypothetical protein
MNDINQRKREWRKRTGNAATNKYEKTQGGKLMRIYRNMVSRINGIQKDKAHLYVGKSLIDKGQFYEWARSGDDYKRLFAEWQSSGYDRKLAPTVDRINPKLGYEIGNMQWVTHSENSRRGGCYKPSLAA